MKYSILFVASLFIVLSCKKNKENQAEKDDTIIKQYISEHGLTATATGSGLYVVVENPGTGAGCTSNSTVKVSYKGYFTDGSVFDESLPAGVIFSLQNVIQGWREGIPYFREGGNGILLIPSALGYGESGSGSIPGNTVLIFEVSLIQVL